jgi:hypothetical protein
MKVPELNSIDNSPLECVDRVIQALRLNPRAGVLRLFCGLFGV